MAKYADYVEKSIDGEIEDAAGKQRARDEKGRFIPERFAGKSVEDVAESYVELEKLNSRQAADLGAMRQTVDQLLEMRQTPASPAPEVTAPPVTVDDLYDDADGNIRRIAREESSDRIEKLEAALVKAERVSNVAALTTKYPDWRTDAQATEFLDWVKDSPYRIKIAQRADALDFDAAEEILGMYYDSHKQAQEEANTDEAATEQQLRDATLESGSPAPTELVDTFSRHDLMQKRISAKQGNLEAETWLVAHGESIRNAYAEGRIVD